MTALLDALSDAMLTALTVSALSMAVPVVAALVILGAVSIRPGRLRLARRRLSREWRMTRRAYRWHRRVLTRRQRPARLARLTRRPGR